MELIKLLEKENISQYKLSKISNVPQTTISDICSNKTKIENCSALTLYKLACSLNITVEDFLTKEFDDISLRNFEIFKSNMCHKYKSMNPLDFIKEIASSNEIQKFFKEKQFAKSFYLLALLDYACDKKHINRIDEFNRYRCMSLFEPLYPESIITLDNVLNTDANKKEAYKSCLPQFKAFNIIESDIENVY